MSVTGIPGSSGATGIPGATGATGQTGPAGRDAPTYRGAFHSTFTDVLSARYTGQPMLMDVTDESDGVTISNDGPGPCSVTPFCGDILFSHAGTYNLQFSAQLSKSATGNYNVAADIWLSTRHPSDASWTDVPMTSTRIYVPTDTDFSVAAWNFMVPAVAGDRYRLMWGSSDLNWSRLSIVSTMPSGYPPGQEPPQIPGLIVTVQSAG